MMDAIYVNEVIWSYDIVIRNKSRNIAYNANVFFFQQRDLRIAKNYIPIFCQKVKSLKGSI